MNALDWLLCFALVVLFGWCGSLLLCLGLELFRGAGRGNKNQNSEAPAGDGAATQRTE